jgi:hypothetical protein
MRRTPSPSSSHRPHLELLMTDPTLGDDDVRALLSDHVEGLLDEATAARVEQALAADPSLARERDLLAQTLAALHALPQPEAPADLVAQVRGRLAAERRAALAGGPHGAAPDVAPALSEGPAPVGFFAGLARHGWGIAAAASVVALIAVAVGQGGGTTTVGGPAALVAGDGVLGAGLAADGHASATVALVAPGFDAATVADHARTAGLVPVGGDADALAALRFRGDGRAVARLVLALQTAGAAAGAAASVDMVGTIPADAMDVVVTVRLAR